MTALIWGASGSRLYEAGVDRGVLYVDGIGYAWNGLVGVSEAPTGGEAVPYYYDGYKYINTSVAEEYAATIEALGAPEEFAVCDGTVSLINGLSITEQPRKSFGFAYRSLLGNEEMGLDYGYKLHLVYNAYASPTTRTRKSLAGTAEAEKLSWGIVTAPPWITGRRPSSHFVIDSTKTPPVLLRELEDMLYGTDTSAPYLPHPQQIIEQFAAFLTIVLYTEDEGLYASEEWRVYSGSTTPSLLGGQEALWFESATGETVTNIYYVSGD